MSSLLEHLRTLPIGVHGLVGLTMVAGLVMWAWGRRVLKPMTVVVSALVCAYATSILVPASALGAAVSVQACVLAGFALGALLGMLVYRSAMALGFGVVAGIAAPLVASTMLAAPSPQADGGLSVEDQFITGVPIETGLGDSSEHDEPEAAEGNVRGWRQRLESITGRDPALSEAAQEMRRFLHAAWAEARAVWEARPAEHRFVLGTSAIGGLAIGILIGLILPARAAGAVTAMFGASVWLPSFVWLSNAWSMPWRNELASMDAQSWLVSWGVISLGGMIIQWRQIRKAGSRSGETSE